MENVLSKNGTSIGMEITGSGDPLVLVHGTSADHTRWTPVVPALASSFTLFMIDRRGRGASGDATPYAIEREYEDIAAVVEHIAQSTRGPVHLLGHSYGALCSLGAATLTGKLTSLILYEPPAPGDSGRVDPAFRASLQQMLDAGDREGVVSMFLTSVAGLTPSELEGMRESPAWPGRVAAAHTILREGVAPLPNIDMNVIAALDTRTLLLVGSESDAFYADFAGLLHATLPNSQLVVLTGQRHVAMNTAPHLFSNSVLEFLKPATTQEGI